MKVEGRVYKIINLINFKIYIGITLKTLLERFEAHLNRAIKERSAIQKSMKKYGKENFIIVQIDEAETLEDLYLKERYWIKHYNSFGPEGYNLTDGGGGIMNMSQEMRDKISRSKKGKKIPKLQGRIRTTEDRIKTSRGLGAKAVKGTHIIFGTTIMYDFPTQAKKDGFNPSLVCAVIHGHRRHHKNYIFEYVDDANPDRPVEIKKSTEVQRIVNEPGNRI